MTAYTIRNAVESAVELMAWTKDTATAASADRKEFTAQCFNVLRNAPLPTDSDYVHGLKLFGDLLKQRGWKSASIKVRKSEFGRIWTNMQHVPADCQSWKAALAAIREATTSRRDIINDRLAAISKAIDSLYDERKELLDELGALSGVDADITFSDEQAEEQMSAIAA